MKPGDKVVCINNIGDRDQYLIKVENRPIKGKIYTIDKIVEKDRAYYLVLVEFKGPWAYEIESFRKLLPKGVLQRELALEAVKESQRIEIFEEVLNE